MNHTFLSSEDFICKVNEAKLAANNGPVFITDRGQSTHVLITFEAYQCLTVQRRNIVDALAMPDVADVDFDPPQVTIKIRQAEF